MGKGGIKGRLVGGFKSKTMIVRVTKHTTQGHNRYFTMMVWNFRLFLF